MILTLVAISGIYAYVPGAAAGVIPGGLPTLAKARALGAQANFSAGDILAPGAALVISPSSKTHMAVTWYLESDTTNIIGLTYDVCPITLQIKSFKAGSFNFTLGVGIFSNTHFPEDRATHDISVTGGLRVPVGFNLLLAENFFEIYVHVAPSFGVLFTPELELEKPFYAYALGARIWFR